MGGPLRVIGINAIATPIHRPKADAIAERVIGTYAEKCLDHVIVVDEQHALTVLAEFVQYNNLERPRSLQIPQLQVRPTTARSDRFRCCAGLHHVYELACVDATSDKLTKH